ncbi:PLP-dependent aminotransferase family protein [soil metagenome]
MHIAILRKQPTMTSIDKAPPAVPLVQQIRDSIAGEIDRGVLLPGAKLESVRGAALRRNVSTMTVTNAYNRLVAEGYLVAKRASGYFVTSDPSRSSALQRGRPFVGRTKVDSLWLIRRVWEEGDSALINAGCGWMPPDWLQGDEVRTALAGLARKKSAGLTNYGGPSGYLPLRQQIQILLGQRAIDVAAHQITLTHGATQGLALAARTLLRPQDAVLVDDPGSTNLFATLRSMDVRLVGVERRLDGPDLVALEALAKRYKPKAFFICTQLHNPTGGLCSPAVAYQILRLAEKYDFQIVENDVLAGFEPAGAVTLASLDQLKRVIYIGSFSKTISPSLRVGYLACSEDLAERIIYEKMVDSLTSSELGEKLVHAVLVGGHYRAHLNTLAERLREAQRVVCDGLEEAGLQVFVRPAGGPFLSARFVDERIDVLDVAQQAVAAGIMLAPGYLFRTDQQPTPWMRFNAGYANNPRLFEFLRAVSGRRGRA